MNKPLKRTINYLIKTFLSAKNIVCQNFDPLKIEKNYFQNFCFNEIFLSNNEIRVIYIWEKIF